MHPTSHRRKIYLFTVLVLLLSINSITATALPSDREQPIRIQSDTAERNEKNGQTTYSGKVEMTQGSLRIEADRITIHSKGSKVTHIIAMGSPARYQQQPELDKELVKATGNTIQYYIDTEKLHLIEQASVKQGGATLKGERIDYDIQSSIMKAGTTESPSRVEMVIPAATTQQSPEPNKSAPEK